MSRAHMSPGQLNVPSRPGKEVGGLGRQLGGQLDPLTAMFQAWQAEAASKRQQALATRGFASESFQLALMVFNKRGERRKGTRKAQDWYFLERHHASSPSEAQPCARCFVCVSRREVFYIDKAKDWKQADELCRQCMQCVMRQVLGDDDDAILEEGRNIRDSGWSPVINSRLADALLDRQRTFFV